MRIFLAIVLAASCGSAFSESHHPRQKIAPQNIDSQQKTTAQPPIIVTIVPAKKSQEDIDQEAKKDIAKAAQDQHLVDLTADLARYTKWLFGATSILAIFTLGLVVVGFRQVRDARESIGAAKISADAALLTAETTQKAMFSQRAYISLRKINLRPIVENGFLTGIDFHHIWANNSPTPANNINVWWSKIITFTDNSPPQILPTENPPPSFPIMLGPNETIQGIDIRISYEELCRIFRNEIEFRIIGSVKYFDVFEPTKERDICCMNMLIVKENIPNTAITKGELSRYIDMRLLGDTRIT
jgi:hypothetical protein